MEQCLSIGYFSLSMTAMRGDKHHSWSSDGLRLHESWKIYSLESQANHQGDEQVVEPRLEVTYSLSPHLLDIPNGLLHAELF